MTKTSKEEIRRYIYGKLKKHSLPHLIRDGVVYVTVFEDSTARIGTATEQSYKTRVHQHNIIYGPSVYDGYVPSDYSILLESTIHKVYWSYLSGGRDLFSFKGYNHWAIFSSIVSDINHYRLIMMRMIEKWYNLDSWRGE